MGKEATERELRPDATRQLKEASTPELNVGGAELARQALGARLVGQ